MQSWSGWAQEDRHGNWALIPSGVSSVRFAPVLLFWHPGTGKSSISTDGGNLLLTFGSSPQRVRSLTLQLTRLSSALRHNFDWVWDTACYRVIALLINASPSRDNGLALPPDVLQGMYSGAICSECVCIAVITLWADLREYSGHSF